MKRYRIETKRKKKISSEEVYKIQHSIYLEHGFGINKNLCRRIPKLSSSYLSSLNRDSNVKVGGVVKTVTNQHTCREELSAELFFHFQDAHDNQMDYLYDNIYAQNDMKLENILNSAKKPLVFPVFGPYTRNTRGNKVYLTSSPTITKNVYSGTHRLSITRIAQIFDVFVGLPYVVMFRNTPGERERMLALKPAGKLTKTPRRANTYHYPVLSSSWVANYPLGTSLFTYLMRTGINKNIRKHIRDLDFKEVKDAINSFDSRKCARMFTKHVYPVLSDVPEDFGTEDYANPVNRPLFTKLYNKGVHKALGGTPCLFDSSLWEGDETKGMLHWSRSTRGRDILKRK